MKIVCPWCNHGIKLGTASTYSHSSAGHFIIGLCPLCDNVTVLLNPNEPDILFPKNFVRPIASEIPEPYKSDFLEACAVLRASPRASAALSRRLLQNIIQVHFKIKLRNLAEEIDEFIKTTTASSYLRDDLHDIRQIGNIAVHPAESKSTGLILDIEPNEAEGLIAVIESLLDFAFVEPKRAQERRKIWKAKKDDKK